MERAKDLQYWRIFSVIVTYDDRYDLLRQSVDGVFANGVKKVIIVDNGSSASSRRAIQKLESNSFGRITVLCLSENRGSAGGFKVGLEYALNCPECEYLWLLDDDNQPAEGALEELLRRYATLNELVELDRLAVVSLREQQEYYNKIARGIPLKKVFARKSSFMGCHLLDQPRKFAEFFRLKRAVPRQVMRHSPVEVPFGPYGGLFFHKSVISRLGYPDERFFVYCDDTEYTYRLTKNGGRLFLVPSSVIHDLQRPWHVLMRGESFFSHLLITDSDPRIYYVTRNQSYLEKHFWTKRSITYTFNKWAFFLLLSLFALKHGKWKRMALIVRAAGEGEAGELGRSADW